MHEFPRMIYHDDGRLIVVNSAEEQSGVVEGGGWHPTPNDLHRDTLRVKENIITPVRPDLTSMIEAIADRVVERLRDEFAPSAKGKSR